MKVKEQFREYFTQSRYDGSYGTDAADEARQSFSELTNCRVVWSQVHGDLKNVVARGMFQPYPHWAELYDSARVVLAGHAALGTEFDGDMTRAKIMGDTMALLRAKHKANAPRWWLPIMNRLRVVAEWCTQKCTDENRKVHSKIRKVHSKVHSKTV